MGNYDLESAKQAINIGQHDLFLYVTQSVQEQMSVIPAIKIFYYMRGWNRKHLFCSICYKIK